MIDPSLSKAKSAGLTLRAWKSQRHLPEARAKRKAVLRVSNLKQIEAMGSKRERAKE